ncbi:sigma factor [Pedobacter sp. UYP1]|uniref:RNA polymerase sigma factor n=1 Tax=Pedobacter sp. UYP1 TaxID=1756396 RepID=UPI003390CA37
MSENRLATVELRESFFMMLYKKAFPKIARYIARNGGSLEEAQDIFQDALVIYYEKFTAIQPDIVVNDNAYLFGIAKNLWLQRYKACSKTQSLNDFDIEAIHVGKPATAKILHYLGTTGKNAWNC